MARGHNVHKITQVEERKAVEERLRERDAFDRFDQRTPQQVFLGDPPTWWNPPKPSPTQSEYSEEDLAAAAAFSRIVSSMIERAAEHPRLPRQRVRLMRPPPRERVRLTPEARERLRRAVSRAEV